MSVKWTDDAVYSAMFRGNETQTYFDVRETYFFIVVSKKQDMKQIFVHSFFLLLNRLSLMMDLN